MEMPSGYANKSPRRPVQQRLSRFWDLPETPRRSKPFQFMDLPLSIREMIYKLVLDFIPNQFRSLNYVPPSAVPTVTWMINHPNLLSVPDDWDTQIEREEIQVPQPEPFQSLFLVSKTIRNECRALIFSQSVVAVSQTRYGGLQTLEDSGPLAWREMRSLVVRMQPCHCLTPYCIAEEWPARGDCEYTEDEDRFFENIENSPNQPSRHHGRRLNSADVHDQNTLCQWERICAGIATHGKPGRLQLVLVCDVDNIALAQRVVQPLYSLPRLRNVVINFGSTKLRFDELRRLAKDTVLQLLGKLPGPEPFRFLDLPMELQVKILQETPLTTENYVKINLEGDFFQWCPSFWQRRCSASDHKEDGQDWPSRRRSQVFLCRYVQAAFSTRCQCYPTPSSWFLVSRNFGDMAQNIFYKHTSFVVIGWRNHRAWPMHPSANADADRCAPKCFRDFLRRMGPNSVRRMRRLMLVFPTMQATYLTPERDSWALWLETLELLETLADLPRLELIVSMARASDPDERSGHSPYHVTASEAEMLEAYKQIVMPMKRLSAVKKLSIQLSWPVVRSTDDVQDRQEQMLMRIVMGESYKVVKTGE